MPELQCVWVPMSDFHNLPQANNIPTYVQAELEVSALNALAPIAFRGFPPL